MRNPQDLIMYGGRTEGIDLNHLESLHGDLTHEITNHQEQHEGCKGPDCQIIALVYQRLQQVNRDLGYV
jgi:hypothetical protein